MRDEEGERTLGGKSDGEALSCWEWDNKRATEARAQENQGINEAQVESTSSLLVQHYGAVTAQAQLCPALTPPVATADLPPCPDTAVPCRLPEDPARMEQVKARPCPTVVRGSVLCSSGCAFLTSAWGSVCPGALVPS